MVVDLVTSAEDSVSALPCLRPDGQFSTAVTCIKESAPNDSLTGMNKSG
jgi:hypothetical protein